MISVYRRLENTLIEGPNGLHMFMGYLPGKPREIEVEGTVYLLEWESDTKATGNQQ